MLSLVNKFGVNSNPLFSWCYFFQANNCSIEFVAVVLVRFRGRVQCVALVVVMVRVRDCGLDVDVDKKHECRHKASLPISSIFKNSNKLTLKQFLVNYTSASSSLKFNMIIRFKVLYCTALYCTIGGDHRS